MRRWLDDDDSGGVPQDRSDPPWMVHLRGTLPLLGAVAAFRDAEGR